MANGNHSWPTSPCASGLHCTCPWFAPWSCGFHQSWWGNLQGRSQEGCKVALPHSGHPYDGSSSPPHWCSPSLAAFQYHTRSVVSGAGLPRACLLFQKTSTVLLVPPESWQWLLPYGRHWSRSEWLGRSLSGPHLLEPGRSKLQSHESAQSHPRKTLLERHAHHAKLGKSRPHLHGHGISPVESRYHYVQTGYPPSHWANDHEKSPDQDVNWPRYRNIL